MEKQTLTVFGLLAYEMRLRMCEVMAKGPMTMEEIAEPMGERGNTIHVHVNKFRNEKLLWTRSLKGGDESGRTVVHDLDKQQLEAALLDFSNAAGLTFKRKSGKAKKVDREGWMTGGLFRPAKKKTRKRPKKAAKKSKRRKR